MQESVVDDGRDVEERVAHAEENAVQLHWCGEEGNREKLLGVGKVKVNERIRCRSTQIVNKEMVFFYRRFHTFFFFFRFWVTRLYGIELWTIGGYCFLLRPVRFLRFFGFYYTCFGWLKLLVYLTTKTKLIENLLSLIF